MTLKTIVRHQRGTLIAVLMASTAMAPVASAQELNRQGADIAGTGFAIKINPGSATANQTAGQTAREQAQDIDLRDAKVKVTHDKFFATRRLNVRTADQRADFAPGEEVRFLSSMNYPKHITRSEVLIREDRDGTGRGRVTIVPIAPNGVAGWRMPADGPDSYSYVLRVYDAHGRFDETHPLALTRSDSPSRPVLNGPAIAPGEGEDRTARRRIPQQGGAITVSGSDLPPNAQVSVMGEPVAVDANGRFVTQRFVGYGDHNVAVKMAAPGVQGYTLEREVTVPRSDWFYTVIADVTIARRDDGTGAGTKTTSEGRLAFYTKGKFDGRYELTAAADTGERGIDELFDGFFDKSPRSVLDRVNPNEVYLTYGDDSTIINDAPTSGRLYAKISEGDSYLMWGDFRNQIEGTRYLNSSRNLYGAKSVYVSPDATPLGEASSKFTAYAAMPENLPQRDVLRGTGGSAYFLKRQDIMPGTETLTLEVVDPVSKRVVSRRELVAGRDYRIDYFQGTVILTDPLSSSTNNGSVVSGGPGGSYDVNLVAQYEYTPTLTSIDGTSAGGRAETWLPGDRLRLGVAAMTDTTDTANLNVASVDARLQLGDYSQIDVEMAQSTGTGFGSAVTTDGGLTYNTIAPTTGATEARAVRVEGTIDLADVTANGDGTLSAFVEQKDAGFTTLSENIKADQRSHGVSGSFALTERTDVKFHYTDFSETGSLQSRDGSVDLAFQLNESLLLETGLRHLDQTDPLNATKTGERTDLGVRVTQEFGEDAAIWAFAQGTVKRSGGLARNDRVGLGGRAAVSQTVAVEGEASTGTGGVGARALVTYRPDEDSRYYAGYELEPGRQLDGLALRGRDMGGIVVGSEKRVNEQVSYFTENNYDMYGKRRSLTSAYGVTYTPTELWSYSGGLETGRVRDDIDGDFERLAVSLGMKHDSGTGITGSLRAEAGFEDHQTDPTRDRKTYLVAGSFGYQVNQDWRFVANADALVSKSAQSNLLDGRYVESSAGFAYRPTGHDRFNALMGYTFLYDMPGSDQVSADGTTGGDRQISHILSFDGIYEVNENWEVGGKLAYRWSQSAPRAGGSYTNNDAAFAALRASYHVAKEWELQGEARTLVMPSSNSTDYGALASVYRHAGDNVKVGVGYNFGRFNDDLRDNKMDDKGLFLNVVAKF
ncbi:hypothetical protein [Pseudooceanicola sp. MF1-13]|uniref:hypothetical protein n=1 Tax=Pseudooceanicola sp. MF1-13 TaxID=3379095 RepID=UPI003892722E